MTNSNDSLVPERLRAVFARDGYIGVWLLTVAEYTAIERAGWLKFRAPDGGFGVRPK